MMKKKTLLTIIFLLTGIVLSFSQERIQMRLESSGIYTVPCEVNGLKLRFVFDTGAADVHLSLLDAAFMLKNGYLEEDDFLGTETYSMADGTIAENALVNLKSIKIGNTILRNVTACVSSKIDASLLLGQSALQKLGAYAIEGSTLILNGKTTTSSYTTTTSTTSNNIASSTTPDSIIYDMSGKIVSEKHTGKGKKVYKSGSVFVGTFKKGIEEGFGTYTSYKGFKYEGYFEHGEYHGQGTYTYEEGDKYVGNFVHGNMSGKGIMYFTDGSRYEGDFVDNHRTGKGTYYFKDGRKYTGDFVNGECEGIGTFTWPSGDKYVGSFKNGYRHGKGTYYWTSGNKYYGDWDKGERTGKGTFYWKDGERYEGDFVKGERTGRGTYYWNTGDRYIGDFVDGWRTGKGTLYYADGRRYDGDFVKNDRTGKGKYYMKSGDRYEGDFVKGQYDGYGTYYWKSGSRHTGYWKDNNREGQGTYYDPSGRTKTGTWHNDEYVEPSYSTSSSNSNVYDDDYYDDDDYYNYKYSQGNNFTPIGTPKYYLATTTTSLNLRSCRSTECNILAKIPANATIMIEVYGAEEFVKAIYIDEDIEGFVSKKYLSHLEEIKVDEEGSLEIVGKSNSYYNQAEITLENGTDKTVTVAIGNTTYKIEPHKKRKITTSPGTYNLRASAPMVKPYISKETIQEGYEYSWYFYIRTIKL